MMNADFATMSSFSADIATQSAPGKLILCGEHAVVYGQPAIALPLADIRAYAQVMVGTPGSGLRLYAPDLGREWIVDTNAEDPLGELALATLHALNAPHTDLALTLSATIPIASGMGSGAAIATAMVRALADWAGQSLSPAEVSALVYTSEQRYHGTPSGIDNTVIAYEQPLWFVRHTTAEQQIVADIEPITIAQPLTLVIGDTGIRSATRLPVGDVRRRWQANPHYYEDLFTQVGELSRAVRVALATGDLVGLGPLLNANQTLLEMIGVSSPELERLVAAARAAGAVGAKLSGAGWGGVMVALTDSTDSRSAVTTALRKAGAVRVLETTVAATSKRSPRSA